MSAAPDRTRGSSYFTSDTVHGVPVARTRDDRGDRYGSRGRGRGNDSDNDCDYDRYAHQVARCNGWYAGSYWSDCGPCSSWQRYDCSDGLALSVGFGSGFSFGFFYGSSGAPLCSSWGNPWWNGYATSWSCAPYAWRWRTYCTPYWYSTCWSAPYACGPCPIPAWTPCYAWSPVYYPAPSYSTVVYVPVTDTPPVVVQAPPALPNPEAMWAFMADGYDRDAEDGFVLLEAAYPNDARWTAGQGIARALRGDTVRAAALLRVSMANDPSALSRLSGDPKFIARLEALERSLAPAATAAQPSIDALLVLSASQAARGALNDAYLNATTAQAEGDRSAGANALSSWLRAELRRTP